MDKDLIKLLGKASDAALGRRFGITRQAVCQLRKARNIPAFTAKNPWDVTVHCKISDKDFKQLSRAAKRSGKSLSAFINAAIIKHIKEALR